MFSIAKHRPHIRVNKCSCGWYYMSRLPEDRDYCPECKAIMNTARRCIGCGRIIESTRKKWCSECAGIAYHANNKANAWAKYYGHIDTVITSIINESNQKRTCGVPLYIECENCPYPDCIEPED